VSDREYVFKMKTCVKELRETLGSLGMARRHGYTNADFAALERECNELIAITVTCIKKARSRYEEWPETKKGKR
jgi:four helix bundle protein